MTQWVEEPAGGRDRGPRGMARAWLEVLLRPRRFFANGVAPGDQGPGLTFVVGVSAVLVGGRLVVAPGSVPGYERAVTATGSGALSAVVVVGVACFLVAPLALHLAAALATLSLLPVASERAGVDETVQVVAYASAPAVFTAVPVPAVQLLAALWGSALLAAGLAVVHGISAARALPAAVLPAAFVFGLALGGFEALEAVVGVQSTVDGDAR